tara:strand:+ start:455 stop:664 length:210 start_codon:yes stop_codon:yes gene_type:complete
MEQPTNTKPLPMFIPVCEWCNSEYEPTPEGHHPGFHDLGLCGQSFPMKGSAGPEDLEEQVRLAKDILDF